MPNPLLSLIAATHLALAALALGADVFDLGVKPPDRAVVSLDESLPVDWQPRSPMLDRLAGVLDNLDKKETLELRKAAMNAPSADEPADASRWCVVHLFFADKSKRVEILRDAAGTYLARDLSAPRAAKPRVTLLKQEDFALLALRWSAARARPTEHTLPLKPGQAAALPQPLVPGWVTIDRDTLDRRFMGSTHQKIDGHVRDLSKTTILARLPKAFSPRTPVGVLVWIDAIEELPTLYPALFPAADELGLAIVGATKTGNNVPRGDRYQLALDSLASLAQHGMIDPDRIYASGESGGGKISTHLWACFPEVFTGAVPIVGLATYTSVPAGPGKVWPQDFVKPNAATLKLVLPHRCAAVTGDQDFNHTPILETAKVLARDKLQVRVFDYPGLAHEVPNAEQFAEALRWVDEPEREAMKKRAKKGEELLAAYRTQYANTRITSNEQRDALVALTREAPWTPEAWQAADLLAKSIKP